MAKYGCHVYVCPFTERVCITQAHAPDMHQDIPALVVTLLRCADGGMHGLWTFSVSRGFIDGWHVNE